MDILVMDDSYNYIEVIDYYESLIWTERYSEAGEFELYLMADSNVFNILKQGYFLYRHGCEQTMIIEQLEVKTDVEDGNRLIVTGRSLESILDRRVVWPQIDVNGNLQNGVKKLLDDNIINPPNTNRKIDKLRFVASTDPRIADLRLDGQFVGDNLYDAICDICKSNNIGWRITLTDDNYLEFKLYMGADHSYSQDELDYVIFSPKFENISSSDYLESDKSLKNMVYIGGDGYGEKKRHAELDYGKKGMARREAYVDGSSVSTKTQSGRNLTEAKYQAALLEKGEEEIAKSVATKSFDGEVENGQTFVYGEHYTIGDIVEIVDEYGHEGQARVTEFVLSHESRGLEAYPNFEMITTQLPDGYAELLYIAFTNEQSLNTGFVPGYRSKATVDFVATDLTRDLTVFTNRNADEPFIFEYSGSVTTNHFSWQCYTESYDTKKDYDSVRHTVDIDSYASRVVVDDPDDEEHPGYERMMLVTRNTNGENNLEIGRYGSMILYSAKIYEAGILIRNFVPCKSPELVVGFYDTINDKFYSSATSTPFVAGPRA